MNHRVVPIFPLSRVVFPGSKIPLRIFEDRYKQMLKHSMSKDSVFGINLIKQGYEVGVPAVPHDVGTIVSFPETLFSEFDEEIFLQVNGKERFKISRILNERPYIQAEIVEYSDCNAEITIDIEFEENFIARVTVFLKKIISLNGGWVKEIQLPGDFNESVWAVANLVQMPNLKKLEILQTSNVYQRSKMLLEHVGKQETEIQNILENLRDQKLN